MAPMTAADVMTTNVITVSPTTSIEQAVQLMIRHHVSGLPVVKESGVIAGIITEGDLLRRCEIGTERRAGWLARVMAPMRLAQDYVHTHASRVDEVMTREVVSVAPEATLAEIVALMEARSIRRLPVLKYEQLVGIVSRADLLRALVQLLPQAASQCAQSALADADLRRLVLARLKEQAWAPCACIDVSVMSGVVELRGVFTNQQEHEALRVLAETTPGVKAVRDELLWIEPSTGMLIEVPEAASRGSQAGIVTERGTSS